MAIATTVRDGKISFNLLEAALLGLVFACAIHGARAVCFRSWNLVTSVRWKVFWSCFAVIAAISYGSVSFDAPPFLAEGDPWTVASFPIIAYLLAVLMVVINDRGSRRRLCERCALPEVIVQLAREGKWHEAVAEVQGIAAETGKLVSPTALVASLRPSIGLEKQMRGDISGATDDFRAVLDLPLESDVLLFRVAWALNSVGQYADACKALAKIESEYRSEAFVKKARNLAKEIHRLHAIRVRCPTCRRALSGMSDMIGERALCTKCRVEFAITPELSEPPVR